MGTRHLIAVYQDGEECECDECGATFTVTAIHNIRYQTKRIK